MEQNAKDAAKMIINHISNAIENGKKTFMCPVCKHKNVCKKIEEVEERCSDFEDATLYQRYSSIHHFFQPIFDWIKFHYPAGEVKFIVDHNSAKMMIEHGPSVFSKDILGNTNFEKLNDNKENKEKENNKNDCK